VKGTEVHNLDDAGLAEFVDDSRIELFNLRFQHATGQLENTGRLRQAKRDIARGMTIARQRGIDVETEIRKLRRNV
jgi:large subunit ribosomal protein L29